MARPKHKQTTPFPTTNNLTPFYILSGVIAALMAAASIAGLMWRDAVYPTEELVLAFLPNDVINLVIGLPILLVSMWLAGRRKLVGLLLWPGALIFFVYNYLIYLLAMPLGWAYIAHMLIVVLSVYTLIALVTAIDGAAVERLLTGAVPERLSGGVLAGFGLLFSLRVIGVLVPLIAAQTSIPGTELALNTADFLMTPAWLIGGVLLWRKKELGYVGGLGLLFQASMLFIGLIGVLVLQPLMIGTVFSLMDTIVVSAMSLVSIIPFILYMRGVLSKQKQIA